MIFFKKDINLIPEEQLSSLKERMKKHYAKIIAMAVIFVCLVSLLIQGVSYVVLIYQNSVAEHGIERLAAVRDINSETQIKDGYLTRRTERLEKLEENAFDTVTYMERVEAALPIDFAGSGMKLDEDGTVTISGFVANEMLAGDVLSVLKRGGLIGDARMEISYESGKMKVTIVGKALGDSSAEER
ncbi:MAG: hypothetical protein LBL34_07205 [Clostridiales bacterium]|jgi:hypothetical protein|nr:hypothetical protein [Clostridiales bacterium]